MTTRNIERRSAGDRPHGRRLRGDDGAALLEFALVSVLFFTLVFGIINYGYMLSFQQDLTRAAAEGARAGAVAYPGTGAGSASALGTQDAITVSGKKCTTTDGLDADGDGMSCKTSVVPCLTSAGNCVKVELKYDQAHHPLLGPIPFFSALPPGTLTASSEARVNA